MKKNEKSEQYPNSEKQPERFKGPNGKALNENETDNGQGAPGVQGQYPGNNDQQPGPNPGGTAPERENPDTMNQNGSSQVALGKRDTRDVEDRDDRKTAQ
jgi:hypothetical protein